jgi:alpha-mannosidase
LAYQFEKLDQLTRILHSVIYRETISLHAWRIIDGLTEDIARPEPDDIRWRDLSVGEWWGASMSWAWLAADLLIPPAFEGKPVALHIEFDALADDAGTTIYSAPEALVTVHGADTTPQAVNESHRDVLLAEQAESGLVRIELSCFTGASLPGGLRVRFRAVELVWIDRDVEALYWDARVLLDAIDLMPLNTPERADYLAVLDIAIRQLNWLDARNAFCRDDIRAARVMLQEHVYSQPTPPPSMEIRPVVHAAGHAHIDLAWLWPLRVTRGKARRTFSTAAFLMQQDPAYKFTQSQPPLYQMVAEDDPALFGEIKARIATGQWNATGATWVEMDTNLPSGESLARQFLFGMRYFQMELGVRPEVLWLPDGFGFTAALPQLMRQSGVRYFFTNKLSWNSHVRIPFDTFWWEGIDGSRVLAHLGTTPETVWGIGRERGYTTYVAQMTAEEVNGTWTNYKQKATNRQLLMPFGMGDGGGGPNREMLERRRRMAKLSGLPRVIHSGAEAFFHALEGNLSGDLPRWVGELYLQFHRGTYTSQSRTKRYNRTSEGLLHDVEALASMLYLLEGSYPHAAINAAWKTVLLNQFHDILPGSSIREVHEEAELAYEITQTAIRQLLEQTLAGLARQIRFNKVSEGFVVFNTLGTTLGGAFELLLPGEGEVEIASQEGDVIPYQWLDALERRALIVTASVPAYGHTVYSVTTRSHSDSRATLRPVTGTPTSLENALLRAEFDEKGNLIRLFDLEHRRDVLETGMTGNQLWIYVDRPPQFDAWEVEAYLHEQGWQLEPVTCHLIENGPLRATLEIAYRFNRSQIVQRVSLIAGQRLLRFSTEVDWHEQHIMLQVHFPVAVRASNASYEIQFGAFDRSTHDNTVWDEAEFEVPAQRWADLSEHGYGVSLLSDSKYGYRTRANVVTLSLLRSPTDPDPQADQGRHQFTYALYPHAGDWREGTVDQAQRLNHPLYAHRIAASGKRMPMDFSLVHCPSSGVIIDTIKKAEDDEALIVRIYEGHGGRQACTLKFNVVVTSAVEVNLLEEPIGPATLHGDELNFSLTPYQIRSFKLTMAFATEIEHILTKKAN